MDEGTLGRIVEAVEPLLDGTGERLDPTHSEAEYTAALTEIIDALAALRPCPFPVAR